MLNNFVSSRFVVKALLLGVVALVSAGCFEESNTRTGSDGSPLFMSDHCATSTCHTSRSRMAKLRNLARVGTPMVAPTVDESTHRGYQLLLGVRLSNDVKVAMYPVYVLPLAGEVALQLDAAYTQQLEAFAPAPAGTRWAGYVSAPQFEQLPDTPLLSAVKLESTSAGNPIIGARAGVVDGIRYVKTDGIPDTGYVLHNSAIDCPEPGETQTPGVDCTGTGTPDDTAITPAVVLQQTDHPVNATDLLLIAPSVATATAGTSATVAFTGRMVGPAMVSGSYTLAATTSIPGGTATPSVANFAPRAAGDTSLPVSVSVPAGTPAGDYLVTTTATMAMYGGSIVRASVGTVRVTATTDVGTGTGGTSTPPDTTAPKVQLTIPKALTATTAGLVRATVTCDEPVGSKCTGSMSLVTSVPAPKKAKARLVKLTLGTIKFVAQGRKATVVTVRLTPAARKLLLKKKALRTIVTVTVKDTAGNARTTTRTVTLKAAKKPKALRYRR